MGEHDALGQRQEPKRRPFGNALWSQMPYFDNLYLCRPEAGGTAAKEKKQTYVSITLDSLPWEG